MLNCCQLKTSTEILKLLLHCKTLHSDALSEQVLKNPVTLLWYLIIIFNNRVLSIRGRNNGACLPFWCPSWRHTTEASVLFQFVPHTVPHLVPTQTSTTPESDVDPPVRRTSPLEHISVQVYILIQFQGCTYYNLITHLNYYIYSTLKRAIPSHLTPASSKWEQ